jgi:hypothetical protein
MSMQWVSDAVMFRVCASMVLREHRCKWWFGWVSKPYLLLYKLGCDRVLSCARESLNTMYNDDTFIKGLKCKAVEHAIVKSRKFKSNKSVYHVGNRTGVFALDHKSKWRLEIQVASVIHERMTCRSWNGCFLWLRLYQTCNRGVYI